MPPSDSLAAEFDAPWKIALELFLEPFLALCFPAAHALIDWCHAPVFLDTELQQIAPEHQQGPRSVDKLVRVRLVNGQEEWLLIHVEVQAQPERLFAERMFVYYYRIWDRYRQRLVSLAVLADDDPQWRPQSYRVELAGCALHFEFPIFKVIECREAEGIFERTGNLFALLVAAQQLALASRADAAGRCEGRFRLVKYLYRRGLERAQMVRLFRLISWLTRLPKEWELQFRERLSNLEQTESSMTETELLSPIELMALEKGLEQGRQEGRQQGRREALKGYVLETLELRFGEVPENVRGTVERLEGEEALRQAHRAAITAISLENFLEGL